MNKNNEILGLLKEKLEMFSQYEVQTNALANAQEDNIDDYITNRDKLANNIDNITQKIIFILDGCDEALINAVYCRGLYSDYSAEQAKINDIATQIYACINRISEKNTLMTDELTAKKDVMLEKIKLSQNTPKIKKYLGALGSTQNESILSGNV